MLNTEIPIWLALVLVLAALACYGLAAVLETVFGEWQPPTTAKTRDKSDDDEAA